MKYFLITAWLVITFRKLYGSGYILHLSLARASRFTVDEIRYGYEIRINSYVLSAYGKGKERK